MHPKQNGKRTIIIVIWVIMLLSVNLAHASVKSVANSIEKKINTVVSRTNSIKSQTESLLERVPDDPSVRGLIQNIEVDKLQTMLDLFNSGISPTDILRIVEVEQQGYDMWVDGGAPDMVRGDLLGFITYIQLLINKTQRLRCLQNPQARIAPMDPQFINDTIGSIPNILLYGLDNTLSELLPNWPSAVSEVNELFPTGFTEGLCEQVDELNSLASSNPLLLIDNPRGENFEMARCVALMAIPDTDDQRLKLAGVAIAKLAAALKPIADMVRDKIHLGLFGNVVAGAGATAGVRNPVKYALAIKSAAADNAKTWIKYVLDERKSCESTDTRMETDLLACNMRFQYHHEAGRYRIQNFYQRKVMPDSNRPYRIDNFRRLCKSYQRRICRQFETETGGDTCP